MAHQWPKPRRPRSVSRAADTALVHGYDRSGEWSAPGVLIACGNICLHVRFDAGKHERDGLRSAACLSITAVLHHVLSSHCVLCAAVIYGERATFFHVRNPFITNLLLYAIVLLNFVLVSSAEYIYLSIFVAYASTSSLWCGSVPLSLATSRILQW